MKIALVHDSFTQLGGAERVVDALHELFPDAPVFCLVMDKKYRAKYKNWNIKTSWLQNIYNFCPKLQYLLPLIPPAVGSMNFKGYDVVISSSSGFVRNIKTQSPTKHIDYCHTPTRFLWSDANYVNQEVPWPLRLPVKWLLAKMKKWDYEGAQRVNYFIANSREVQKRIKQYYNRDGEVIYPFIDTNFWHPTKNKGDYFLIVGRLHAHKKYDLIVEVFSALGGSASGGNESKFNLHVVGTGRQEEYLRRIARPNVTFLGQISDEQLRDEYSGAKAIINPQIEDFGLVPLEAAACGAASLGVAKAGNLETIVSGVTGELFNSYDKNEIKSLIINWNISKYIQTELVGHAQKFSKDKFKKQISEFVGRIIKA